jgi:hypothetical protein
VTDTPKPTPEDIERAGLTEDIAMLTGMVHNLKARCVEYAARLAANERALAEAHANTRSTE